MFIFETERDRAWMGGGAEREGDTESETGSRLWAVSTEPDAGLEPTNGEIMTWAEVGRWTNQVPFNFSTLCWHIWLKSGALVVTCHGLQLSFFLMSAKCPSCSAFKIPLLWEISSYPKVDGMYGDPHLPVTWLWSWSTQGQPYIISTPTHFPRLHIVICDYLSKCL